MRKGTRGRRGQVSHMSREEMLSIFAERGGDPDRRANVMPWTRCCGVPPARVNRRGRPVRWVRAGRLAY